MKSRHKRMIFIVLGLAGVAVIATLVLEALQSNINHFFSPTEVAEHKAPESRTFRLGGLVEEGSLKRDGVTVHFRVTDKLKTITVAYTGILPDLFKEGAGVVAQGKMGADGVFTADEVLAKHDENYMPPEVAKALAKGEQAKENAPLNHADTTTSTTTPGAVKQ